MKTLLPEPKTRGGWGSGSRMRGRLLVGVFWQGVRTPTISRGAYSLCSFRFVHRRTRNDNNNAFLGHFEPSTQTGCSGESLWRTSERISGTWSNHSPEWNSEMQLFNGNNSRSSKIHACFVFSYRSHCKCWCGKFKRIQNPKRYPNVSSIFPHE